MVSYKDIEGIIALAIRNNRPGFISAMNASGYPVSSNISEDDLFVAALTIMSQKGPRAMVQVLNRVSPIKSEIPQSVKEALSAKFAPANQRSFGDWFNNTVSFFGDLIGGSTIIGTAPISQVSSSTSALSPGMLILTVAGALILIGILRKYTVAVVLITIIAGLVVLYGIFAKKTVTTVSGGGTTTETHQGIGSAITGFLTGLFA